MQYIIQFIHISVHALNTQTHWKQLSIILFAIVTKDSLSNHSIVT